MTVLERAPDRASLRLRRKVAALKRRSQSCPLPWIRWLPGQDAFLRDPAAIKLIRQGNQYGGKTTVGLAEVIHRCLGTHPFLEVRPPPIEAWIVCTSWSQSVAIQKKLWLLLPKDEITDDTTFDEVNGFTPTKNPVVQFKNGSLIRIRTAGQNALNQAGATIDVVMFDEPPKTQRIYGELSKRVLRREGVILLTLTPINAPVDWLQELVAQGQISDHHFPLTPENLIPVGYEDPLLLDSGRPMDAAWIEEVIAGTLAEEVPVVCHGEWECRVEGRLFKAFAESRHVAEQTPPGEVKLALGIDYGTKIAAQVALLMAVLPSKPYPRVWVLDEAIGTGDTSDDEDAREVLAMLRRWGVQWGQLDHPWGDRILVKGVQRKGNKELMRAIARQLPKVRRWQDLSPKIRTVKRGAGRNQDSVRVGARFLHQLMVRDGHFTVNPRCEQLIKSLNRWDGRDDDFKHIIDALRYGLQDYVYSREARGPAPKLRLYGGR